MTRVVGLGVNIAHLKTALEGTIEDKGESQKFLHDSADNCEFEDEERVGFVQADARPGDACLC